MPNDANEFQPGEVVSISCEPADAQVVKVTDHYVSLKWPWRELDSSSQMRWNGLLALPRHETNPEWANTPWRVEPDPSELAVGDICMVGIPATRVLVREVQEFDPPRALGWLPKPTLGLSVVEVGDHQDDESAGYLIYVDGAEPIQFHRIS